jgi:hypothetical protein
MDWMDELVIALTIYREIQKSGAAGEVDIDATITIKATGQVIPVPTIPIQLPAKKS